ncbi:glycerophosphoryl diester phosphodiesterase [Paramagnetospirillum marisnigri]|uniref:Glycerophosphoryl diester phosphodiesterase n=1 Tax=Paramagnetospirillum marisnigri TaxID=1285242 RepID=A0A178MTP3_9PROT|nr:glycerophosphodiester phosphodiesterase [Paramagnetospirillum marisnigri]OAN52176.1 glycerophosphoryl diester phosphodiesterase [Paramagnetospirillum marisnigri]
MIRPPPVIGHRGAAGLAPENTLASFRQAAALGAGMVEFDARLSADGVPLVFHDDGLARTTNGVGEVAEMSWAELARLDAGAWFGADFAGEAIPRLDRVLTLCLELGLAVNMEIKPDAGREAETARVCLEAVRGAWPAEAEPPLISSFARSCLEVARDLAPAWPRGMLVETVPPDWRAEAGRLGCEAIHAEHDGLESELVAEITASGLLVMAYTVNDKQRQQDLWEMGVTAVFTDFPYSS